MQDARVRAALIALCLACLLGSGLVLYAGHHTEPPPVVITPPPAEAVAASPPPIAPTVNLPPPASRLYVDVAGAVRRPSLYALPEGSRIMQAVVAAGGPTAEADLDAVNLAQKIADGEKIFVPKRGPAPVLALDAPERLSAPETAAPHAAVKETHSAHSNKLSPDTGEQIALNTATLEDLERLPGVGPAMAGRILAYRAQAGGFGKVEDLMQVTGIGPKKFAKIAPFVKLN